MEKPSKSERKARIRAWKDTERKIARDAFPLPDEILSRFFDALEEQVDKSGCDHSTDQAFRAASDQGISEPDTVRLLEWCADNGGFCDCEIVLNTFGHWHENRSAGL